MFIDKYSAVEHILNPILRTSTPSPSRNEGRDAGQMDRRPLRLGYVLKVAILADFFKYAFDGSGADNFFDAGSASTAGSSAWHGAASCVEALLHRFKLAGFTSFDGQFQT